MPERKLLGPAPSEQDASALKVVWNDSKMQTTYANVVNAASTREEVSVFFGTNQTWNFREQKEVTIELTNRIVLNPYAAKRLNMLLTKLVNEHEKRFGSLQLEADAKLAT